MNGKTPAPIRVGRGRGPTGLEPNMSDTTTKRCPRCEATLSVAEFNGRKNSAGVRVPSGYCRPCQAVFGREWRVINGNSESIRRRAQYRDDPEVRSRRKEENARRYAADPDPQRNTYLLAKYGITLVEYRRMEDAQRGLCAICGEACKSGRALAVDHDHATGVNRGLLCIRCNNGIGNFRDDWGLLAAAIDYLTKPKEPAMPNDYVEDYEQVTGKTRVIETKVIAAPKVKVAPATEAEVK